MTTERPGATVAWFDGGVVPFAEARVPIEDRGLQFSESLYEVVPVVGGRPRELAAHVLRMRTAATVLGLAPGVPPLETWEARVAELITHDGVDEGTVYAQLTGGVAPRIHTPPSPVAPRFWAYVRSLRFPRAERVERGVTAVTVPDLRWGRCDLKTTMLLPAVLAKREAAARGANEAILVGPDDLVHEGASSNVFLVEGNAVVTPPRGDHLLPGITRPLALEIAAAAGYRAREEPIAVPRLRAATELFITSTTNLAMPVVRLDGAPVGSGETGPVARAIAAGLRRRLGLSD